MARDRMDLTSFVGKLLKEDDADILREGIQALALRRLLPRPPHAYLAPEGDVFVKESGRMKAYLIDQGVAATRSMTAHASS